MASSASSDGASIGSWPNSSRSWESSNHWPGREALLAALNGVLGDYLAASNKPLAIAMHLRRGGIALPMEREALAAAIPQAGSKIVVLLHGLCMSDLQWKRHGHDHGAALANDLGYTAVYLHYNSGLHISSNGRAFAELLESLVERWPVPVTELALVGHSMGGLVARSACHYGKLAHHAWLGHLAKAVFVGTPHHGAPLERGGNWVDLLLGTTPYSAPLARLGKIRSAGITDLRFGYLLDKDWKRRDRFAPGNGQSQRRSTAGGCRVLRDRCHHRQQGRRSERPVDRRRHRAARERDGPPPESAPHPAIRPVAAACGVSHQPPRIAQPARSLPPTQGVARRSARRARVISLRCVAALGASPTRRLDPDQDESRGRPLN